jgi:hypothetical protein
MFSALPAESGHRAMQSACPFRANNGSRHVHSITTSVRAISDGGTVRPSALAVLRLITRLGKWAQVHVAFSTAPALNCELCANRDPP